jgi:hypothetical protein
MPAVPTGRRNNVCRVPFLADVGMKMEKEPGTTTTGARGRRDAFLHRTDSYGVVLLLFVLDYIAVSAVHGQSWGRVCIVLLLGLTLWYSLRVSQARRIWQLLAIFYTVASTVLAIVSELTPGEDAVTQRFTIAGGVLLIITPVAILRRISTHPVITVETILGAVAVYLQIGLSFAFMYSAVSYLSGSPFFAERTTATINEYVFFSYTTLTTVGYGNLVPAGTVGQTFAMLEALFGQIYLVIVVARLVSLWGQERPRTVPHINRRTEPEEKSSEDSLPGETS